MTDSNQHTHTSVDERALSPVVGVSVLISLTVVLMATIGVFVLGGVPGDPQPNAELVYQHNDSDSDEFGVIGHARGDTISGDTLVVQIDGDITAELTPGNGYQDGGLELDPPPEDNIAPGDTINITDDSADEYELVVIHEPTNSVLLEASS